jgi:hypothetical protein
VGGPGLALDDEAYADPRPGFGFSLTPKESTATSADVLAAHAAAPGLFTTRCTTHGVVALVIPLNCRDTSLHHCYRTLAAVEGKASVEQVRVGAKVNCDHGTRSTSRRHRVLRGSGS